VFTLILGALVGVVIGVAVNVAWPGHPVVAALFSLAGFFGTSLIINLRVKKKLEAVFTDVQNHVQEVQDQLRRKITMIQNKNMSGGKGLQKRIEKEQADGIREALKIVDKADPLGRWNLLAQRQANTLRAQLCYQIKDFEKADRYFEKCLVMDPVTLAMKMARQYQNRDMDALKKAFKKGVKRFKDEKGVLIYALYTWILVQEERIDDAVAILDDAKEKTEDETLRTNWEHLANGRVRRFSNAGLGEQWYALHLEAPKPVKVRQQRFGGKMRRR
jgi:tetratricopeptide (TPR) repeat protein